MVPRYLNERGHEVCCAENGGKRDVEVVHLPPARGGEKGGKQQERERLKQHGAHTVPAGAHQLAEHKAVERHDNHVNGGRYVPHMTVEIHPHGKQNEVREVFEAGNEHEEADQPRKPVCALAPEQPRHHEIEHGAQPVYEIQ